MTTQQLTCPSNSELSDYLNGFTSESRIDGITDHLSRCWQCQRRLSSISSDDTDDLLRLLRQSRFNDGVLEERACLAIDRLAEESPDRTVLPQEDCLATTRSWSRIEGLPSQLSGSATPPPPPLSRSVRASQRRLSKVRNADVKSTPQVNRWFQALTSSAIFHLTLLSVLAMIAVAVPQFAAVVLSLTEETGHEPLVDLRLHLDEIEAPLDNVKLGNDAEQSVNPSVFTELLSFEIDPTPLFSQPRQESYLEKYYFETDDPFRFEQAPSGKKATSRHVADYQEALHQLTIDIIAMVAEGARVRIIWCFDESHSMRDDRQKIIDEIQGVYDELERQLTKPQVTSHIEALVTSFGNEAHFLMNHPTADPSELAAAMDRVSVDGSGKERMCMAILSNLRKFQRNATRDNRRTMLVMVTDESGEPSDIESSLEDAVTLARQLKTRIYFLGREAVFGYPYAYRDWTDETSVHSFKATMNRGPETAIPAVLLTDGFIHRLDGLPSGYGPYAQCRLASATGGKFLVLPGPEARLIRDEERRYRESATESYQPDLSPLKDCYDSIRRSKFRGTIVEIVRQLNPEGRRQTPLVFDFPTQQISDLLTQVTDSRETAMVARQRFVNAAKALNVVRARRDEESSKRWQANFDLMEAQLKVYPIMLEEYVACLDRFEISLVRRQWDREIARVGKPVQIWRVDQRRVNEKRISEAVQLFEYVRLQHPGTPWSARAESELKRVRRGLGWIVKPDFHRPSHGRGSPIPIETKI